MLPAKVALSSGKGYSSVYQFSREDAKTIRARGHSRGLKEFKVYAERLWLDIDDEDLVVAKQRFEEMCTKFGGYDKIGYFSGKKGYHLGIKIEPMYGLDVPYSHKKWIRDNAIVTDESLYQHGRLFRNPGCIHESTGKPKTRVVATEGATLQIPLVIEPAKVPPPLFTEGYTETDVFRDNLIRALTIIENPPAQGMRHTTLWSFSQSMCESGASYQLAYEMASYLNNTFDNPKDDEELERAVRQGYGI